MRPQRWWCAATALVLVLASARAGESKLRPYCTSTAARCTYQDEAYLNEFFYNVSGSQVIINFRDGVHFHMICNDTSVDNPDLPRFPTAVRVRLVTFTKCAPPINGSIADAAAALNVTDYSRLTLAILPAMTVITHAHLAGLQRLTQLEIYGNNNTSLEPGALAALSAAPALHNLILNSVRTPAADLARLPLTLRELKLWNVKAVSTYFEWMPNLILLDVSEKYSIAINVSNATALKVLSVSSPNTVVPEDALPPTLTTLNLVGWNDTQPVPKTRCEQLTLLRLTGTNNDSYRISLPDKWLSSCSKLEELHMYHVPIGGVLPELLLANTTALHSVTIQHCNLSALPQKLFDDTPNLVSLDLSFNELTSLPSGLFLHTKSLQILNLSHNLLTSTVAESLSAVFSLKELRLNHNPQMGDLCSSKDGAIRVTAGDSRLESLTSLHHLYLSHTNVSRVCRDWRLRLVNLELLDLKDTAITILNYDDLQYPRAKSGAIVNLGGGSYELQYQRWDYNDAHNDQGGTKARVLLSGSLVCDCITYWAAETFRNKSTHAPAIPTCDKKPLQKVDLDMLTCDASKQCAALPANCTCRKRDDVKYGTVVIVQCAGLTEFPRLPPANHKWRLQLANNNISNIAAADVSKDIVELDLRNNSIKRVDGETAAQLAQDVLLQLAGNPIECGCESYEMLSALLGTNSRLQDKTDTKCSRTGKPLTAVTLKPCTKLATALVLTLAVLLATVVITYGVLSRPATRLHIKMFLIRLGWMPRRLEPTDDDRPYDAFVSFAHEDEELVVEQLATRLESGSRPYRLCLHYRDWAPGEWIPAQIAASVRASRRTVAVVSAHYLQSDWARAEFREATAASLRDGTPRLIVVLLDEPDRLTLDVDHELSAYVRNKTYVRWGDPWFWEKLKQALPLPRAHRLEKAPLPPATPDIPVVCTHTPRESASASATAPSPASAPISHDPDKTAPRATPCSA